METMLQDLRYALRALRRSPGFTVVAMLTLALGIGANTAIFSVLNAVVLRPLSLPEADRLTHLGWTYGEGVGYTITETKFEFWREHNRSFDGIATWQTFSAEADGTDGAALRGLNVSSDFFRVVGVEPQVGRSFGADEYQPARLPLAVIGDEVWRGRFGGAADVIGGEILLDGVAHTVIGVMPPGFRLPQVPDHGGVLRPMALRPNPDDLGHNTVAFARLRDGVTPQQAQADLDRVLAAFRERHPTLAAGDRESMRMIGFDEIYVGDLRGMLWLLLAAIGFVLLIACANVANLLLARATERQREITVRLALGAGPGRIVRQLLTESVVLAVFAGLVGIGVASWGVDALLTLSPTPLPRQDEIGLDWRVLLFALLLATGTGVLFGLTAGIPASRTGVAAGLRDGGRAAGSTRGVGHLRAALVVAQAALAVVLLSGAGLLIATFSNLRSVETGFRVDDVLAVSFSRAPSGMRSAADFTAFQERVRREIELIPGVRSVATTSVMPLGGQSNFPMMVVGRDDASETAIQIRAVSPGFFETLDVPVRSGRGFTEGDRGGAPGVIIINEATARHYFPDENPIGQRIQVGATPDFAVPDLNEPVREIVGVVGDTRVLGLRQNAPRMIYLPQAQMPEMLASLPAILVRAPGGGTADRRIVDAIRAADPRLPQPTIRPLASVVGVSLGQERFIGTLLTLFAALALLLTGVGIYGVISYNARRRTREIGVRIALGASPGHVLRLITRQGVAPVALGLLIGVIAAAFATSTLEGLLFEVTAHDPVTFMAVSLVLSAVAVAAAYLPARRATRVDPMTSLRQE
jgi:putative ABC transport system permease protein